MSTPQQVGSPQNAYPSVDTTGETTGLDEDTLITAAGQSAEIENSTQRVQRRSLNELIAMDKHLANKKSPGGWGSVGIVQMVPPSAIG